MELEHSWTKPLILLLVSPLYQMAEKEEFRDTSLFPPMRRYCKLSQETLKAIINSIEKNQTCQSEVAGQNRTAIRVWNDRVIVFLIQDRLFIQVNTFEPMKTGYFYPDIDTIFCLRLFSPLRILP